jgi:AhpD family alkylhydroperoxidase
MLDKTDTEKIEKIIGDLKYVHKSFTSRDSKCYDHYMKLLNHAMEGKSLTRMTKELIAVGISAYANCEPCMTVHVRAALREGATDDQVAEAVDVAIEMGGGPVVARGASYVFKLLEYFGDKGR